MSIRSNLVCANRKLMRNVVSLAFIILPFFSNSQNSILPDSCTKWDYAYYDHSTPTILYTETHNINATTDTIIDGLAYLPMYYQSSLSYTTSFYGGIREVNDSILLKENAGENDRLIWDFSATVGDTVRNIKSKVLKLQEASWTEFEMVITGIDSIASPSGDSLLRHEYSMYRWKSELDTIWDYTSWAGAPTYFTAKLGGSRGLLLSQDIIIAGGGSSFWGWCSSDLMLADITTPNFCEACSFPTAVDENEIPNINLYPNPSSGRFWLSGQLNEIEGISVYSRDGKLLLNRTVQADDNATVKLDCSDFNPGYYILRMDSQNHVLSRSLIIR